MAEKIGLEAIFDVSDFNKGLKQYEKGLSSSEKETKAATKSNSKSIGDFSSVLGKLGAGFTMAAVLNEIRRFGEESIREFQDFDNATREVFTLMPDLSAEATQQMRADILAYSQEVGRVTDETVPALYQAISAGVPAENVFDFLRTANEAARGGVTSLETAVDGITSVMNAYGSEVISATEASDLMFTAVKLGKTNFEQLSKSLFNVVPTAAAIGVGFNEITAALAAMTAQGVPTSVATTQLRQVLVELSKEGTKVADTFEQLTGVSFRDFVASGGTMQQALQVLEQEAARLGIGINDLFGSVEAGGAALALTGQGTQKFTDALQGMAESTGATAEAAETMGDSLETLQGKVDSASEALKIMTGEVLEPTKSSFLETKLAVIEFGQSFAELFKGFQDSDSAWKGVEAALDTQNLGLIENRHQMDRARFAMSDLSEAENTHEGRLRRLAIIQDLFSQGVNVSREELRAMVDAEIAAQDAHAAYQEVIEANIESLTLQDEKLMQYVDTSNLATESTILKTQAFTAEEERLDGLQIAYLRKTEAERMAADVTAQNAEAMALAAIAAEEERIRLEALDIQLGSHFVNTLTSKNETTNFSLALFDAASSAGLGADALRVLAGATGEYTAEEIEAAFQTALMKQNIDLLVGAMQEGRITADQATVALQALESGQVSTAESAIGLALGFSESAITAGVMKDRVSEVAVATETVASAIRDVPTLVSVKFESDLSGFQVPAGFSEQQAGQGGGVAEFAEGGYTGSGDGIAGIVHQGEYVFSPTAVRQLGLGFLNSLHEAGRSGVNPASNPAQSPVVVQGGDTMTNYNLNTRSMDTGMSLREQFMLMEMASG